MNQRIRRGNRAMIRKVHVYLNHFDPNTVNGRHMVGAP